MATSPDSPPPLNTALLAVTRDAVGQLDPIWALPAPDVINGLFDVLPTLIDTWGTAASSAAATWYDQLREAEAIRGRFMAIVKPLDNNNPGAEALAGWGAEPLAADKLVAPQSLATPLDEQQLEADAIQAARDRVEGGLQKRIVNSANLTITDSSNQDPQARGWMRTTRPGACKFCVMVASRGGVFTKASATFACHENCYCQAIPAWGGKSLPVGPYKPSDKPSNAADRARVRRWIADNL